MQKEKARESIKEKFAQITEHEKKTFNDNIFKNFVELFDLKEPLKIGSYISKENEVCSKQINNYILEKGSELFLPKIYENQKQKKIKFFRFLRSDSLIKGKYNLMEPKSLRKPIEPNYLDFIIIPVRAVNKANKRLGFGGGFYDRSLKSVDKLKFLSLCYEFQYNLPFKADCHDLELTTLIYPCGYFKKA
tara:strand:- start:25 stop:594 length:570 start_codon:yes stop_codon:yes gene_type:complete